MPFVRAGAGTISKLVKLCLPKESRAVVMSVVITFTTECKAWCMGDTR